mmetsp:Transcript_21324/g.35262  ORF Transcript_21324/g.35262 Transcript_21324/m.35262 type:complete len:118 (-) Transcript_21324:1695-2048(-)
MVRFSTLLSIFTTNSRIVFFMLIELCSLGRATMMQFGVSNLICMVPSLDSTLTCVITSLNNTLANMITSFDNFLAHVIARFYYFVPTAKCSLLQILLEGAATDVFQFPEKTAKRTKK